MSHNFSDHCSWIWTSSADDWVMFRKSVDVSPTCCSATLQITAGFHYIASINGQVVARGPGRSYDFSKVYDEVDVFPFLTPGRPAVVAVLALSGPSKGLLAELTLIERDGGARSVVSDASWRTLPHPAFGQDTAGYAIPLGREEHFDARLEPDGWTHPAFDDSAWPAVVVLGPVGMAPWVEMERNPIGQLSQDLVLPRSFAAVELALRRPGYRFRLSFPSECMKVFATEVTCATPASLRLHFSSVEPTVTIDGQAVQVSDTLNIPAGTHLMCCCQLGYGAVDLELLIETKAELDFSTRSLLDEPSAAWVVYAFPAQIVAYPWHETPASLVSAVPAVQTLLTASEPASIPSDLRRGFQAATHKQPSAYLDVRTQQYVRTQGGYALPAIEAAQPRLRLDPTPVSTLRQAQRLLHAHADSAVILPLTGFDHHFVVDFGREVIGHVQFTVDAPAGAMIDVQGFELIDGRGIAWMENHNGFRYTCREGVQTCTSHYRRGFRYLSVTVRGIDRPLKFYALACLHTAYPVEVFGDFACSDWQLNQVYRMSVDTAALCMLDTYVDCPGHEQNFWVGDARITALVNLLTFGAYDLNQRSIRLVGQSLSEAWVNTYWPTDERYTSQRYLPIAAFPNYPEGGLPMWTFQWILQCWEHYLYGGSLADLAENYAYVAETLRRCGRLTNERGLLEIAGAWNLIEWGNNDLSPYGEVTANNVLLVKCLECAASMARALGQVEQAEAHLEECEQRRQAIQIHCWSEARRAYVDTVRDEWAYQRYLQVCAEKGWQTLPLSEYRAAERISEQTNTLAFLCGCVPEARKDVVWDIVQRPREGQYRFGSPAARSYGPPSEQEARGGIVAVGSPFFLFFSLAAMFQNDQAEDALKVIRRDWGTMAMRGTPTCWETFDMNAHTWTRSAAHAWSAAPAIYLPEHVLGIQPLEPGFGKFRVEPCVTGLEWARGSVATPHGPIFVAWQRDQDGILTVTCAAPDECERVT